MARKFNPWTVTTPRLTCRTRLLQRALQLPHRSQWQTMLTRYSAQGVKNILVQPSRLSRCSPRLAQLVLFTVLLVQASDHYLHRFSGPLAHALKHVQDCRRAASWCFPRQRTYRCNPCTEHLWRSLLIPLARLALRTSQKVASGGYGSGSAHPCGNQGASSIC